MRRLDVGDTAPDFTLRDQHGQEFQLSSYAGEKAVLLVFYPHSFSSVCTGELIGLRDRLGDFETETTTVAAISCDSVYTQRAVADRDALFFPVLADFWPHGAVSEAYGVFDAELGSADRSSFVVGRDGLIAWAHHGPRGISRDLTQQATRLGDAG